MSLIKNITKDSHFTLLKVYSAVRSIEDTVGNVESDYVYPKNELSIAQSELHSDLHACLKHLKKALNLYKQEVALARRYSEKSDKIQYCTSTEIQRLNSQYKEALRSGNYREAEKALRALLIQDIPETNGSLIVILSTDRTVLTVQNISNRSVSIRSASVRGEKAYGGGFIGNILPGSSVDIVLSEALVGSGEVKIDYFMGGQSHTLHCEVGE